MKRGAIIAIVGKKGGVGKSTVSSNLAVSLAVMENARVSGLDCDYDQQTFNKWAKRRLDKIEAGEKLPAITTYVQSDNIRESVLKLAEASDIVIIDVAGRDSKALRQALIISDLVYIPVRPSQNDIETLDDLHNLVQETQDLNPKRKVKILFTLSPTNPLIAEQREAEAYVEEFKELMPLSKVILYDRKAYRDASIEGKGVIELKDTKAAQEIKQLTKEVMTYV